MKECADQAEKVIVGEHHPADILVWRNHYSPKYNRCFIIEITVSILKRESSSVSVWQTQLIDAFEKAYLALSLHPGTPEVEVHCHTTDDDRHDVDCAKAESFISEHMKN